MAEDRAGEHRRAQVLDKLLGKNPPP